MYFPDLTEYTYCEPDTPEGVRVLNVGWLDHPHPYPKGDVASHLQEKLLLLCLFHPVSLMMGYHVSAYLAAKPGDWAHKAEYRGNEHLLGDGEIRVPGRPGVVYACPTLICLYVRDAGYLPPQEFLNALECVQLPIGKHSPTAWRKWCPRVVQALVQSWRR